MTIGAKTELTMIGNGNKLSGGTDYVIINGGTGTTYAGSSSQIDMNGAGDSATVTGYYDLVNMNTAS